MFYAVIILYLISVGVIVFDDGSFYVVTPLLIALYLGALLLPLILVGYLFSERRFGYAIAIIHIALAIIFHPAARVKKHRLLDYPEQSRMLRTINSDASFSERYAESHALAVSLRTNAFENENIDSPFWYWIYPHSLVFGFWGVLALFLNKKLDERFCETGPEPNT